MALDYFYGQAGELFSFYRIPKALFQEPRFQSLSTDAKTLYGILLDRMSLSVKNGWLDEQNRVFIIFTIEDVKRALCCADNKATKLLRELEKFGLIERKRRGLGKPSLVYVKNFSAESSKSIFQNRDFHDSGGFKNASQDPSKSRCNKTKENDTEMSETDPFYSKEADGMSKRTQLEEYFSQSLEVELLLRLCPDDEDAAHHNAVFVGRDADGHPRYASCRGIHETFRQDVAGAEKSFGFAHRGTDKQLMVFEAPIDLLSFIELFPKNWQQHNYLSLGGVSGKALRQFLSERPDVERVFLCLDADKAGEDACKRLAALLPDTVSVTRIQPCMKDWNDVLVHRAESPNRNYFKSIVLKEPSKPETVKIIRMSDVELTPVEWLWKPYLPFGKLSVLQGNPGEGKTYFAMHLAAACTNGKLLPNMERMEPFNVIYQTAEDGLGDTVKPRLTEAGADLDRVLVIDDSDVQLTLSDERIEKAIVENNARLVIIDPIQAYLGADVDMNRANEVRPIFMRLGQVAQRTGCAILLIGHLNKAAGMQSLQRGLGSIDIAAAVRSVLFIGKLKHDPTMRILTHEKSSLAPPGVSLAFSLGDEDGFRWVGEYDITADEMLSGIEPQRETKTQQAKDLICALLAEGKQVLSEDIDKAALERGIPGRTVRDAKRELGNALKSKIVEGRKKVFWME